jgi:hypothetical protein
MSQISIRKLSDTLGREFRGAWISADMSHVEFNPVGWPASGSSS